MHPNIETPVKPVSASKNVHTCDAHAIKHGQKVAFKLSALFPIYDFAADRTQSGDSERKYYTPMLRACGCVAVRSHQPVPLCRRCRNSFSELVFRGNSAESVLLVWNENNWF